MPLLQSLNPREPLRRHLLLLEKRRLSAFPEILSALLEHFALFVLSCVLLGSHRGLGLSTCQILCGCALSCYGFLYLDFFDVAMGNFYISLEISLLQVLSKRLDFSRHPRCNPLLFFLLIKSREVEFQLRRTHITSLDRRRVFQVVSLQRGPVVRERIKATCLLLVFHWRIFFGS